MRIKIFSATHSITYNTIYEPHMHDFYEFYLILSDGVKIETEYGFYNASFGDFFIFEPFSFHKIVASNMQYNRCCIHIDENSILNEAACLKEAFEFIRNTKPLHFKSDIKTTHKLIDIFDKAVFVYQNNVPMKNFQIMSCIGEIFTIIQTLPHLNQLNPRPQDQFSKILKYVHNCATTGISIKDICDKFFISSTTLHKLFKENMMVSPGEYIIRLKLNYAMELLQKGATVTETADQSGFNSYSHFIRIFKKRIGLPPHKYAKQI